MSDSSTFINLHQPSLNSSSFRSFPWIGSPSPVSCDDRTDSSKYLWSRYPLDHDDHINGKLRPAVGPRSIDKWWEFVCQYCVYIYSFLRNCFVRVYYTKNIYMLWAVLWRHMVHNFSNSWYTESTVVNYVKSSEIMDINLYVSYFVMVSWLRLPSSEELNFSLRGVWHHYTTSNARMLVSCNHEKHIFAIRTTVKTAFRVWLSKG